MGSAAELKTQVYIGMKIEYIGKEMGKKWIEEIETIAKMVGGLKRKISNDKRQTTNDKRQPEVADA